ncbi:hypothetical protein SNE40_007802 [Patella caerulea]|uniref:RRP12-like protein n=1 Tax=Patella caerulea TaxID=87958 RepID=A0AAN8K5B2_PATCE
MGARGKKITPKGKSNTSNVGKWKKGQSSSSNPVSKKFRDAAKNRLFQKNTGPSNLTVAALAKHNEGETEIDGMSVVSTEDAKSTTAKTFSTWATNWTDCTNATFSRVHRYWASNSAMHKEILAVLAAVTEVIKQQGGSETETEYFAALMTALETADSKDSLAAISYLLNLAIKKVPAAVLKSRFSQISKQLLDYLAKYADGTSTSLTKSLLLCLAAVLRVQDQGVWNHTSTHQIYNSILTFITHKKPRIRKTAHQCIQIVLKGSLFMTSDDPPPVHPAASLTAKYCNHEIEQCAGSSEAINTLYTLGLLREVLGTFSQNSLKSTCENILRVMTISNPLVKASGMQALHGMFSSKPKAGNLPAELNAQIITALYDYQPSEHDSQPMRAWLAVMEKAHVNLARIDEKLGISHLPKLFSVGMTCLLSNKPEVASSASKTLMTLLSECVAPTVDYLKVLVTSAPTGSMTPIHKIVKACESGLSYQFHSTWKQVFQLLALLFEVIGKHLPELIENMLITLVDLRESSNFSYKADVDHIVGSAIKSMGPRLVLKNIPLNITGEDDDTNFPRSWLLPILSHNIQHTELAFFSSYFLPLSAKFRQTCVDLRAEKRFALATAYEALQKQIWGLLQGFCTHPSDLSSSFKSVAKIMGTAISERQDLKMEVMAALRKLINQNLENEANKAELARFAKNFLPILFNLFTTDPKKEKEGCRLAALTTIKAYLQITDLQLAESFFDTCVAKINDADITPARRIALTDLTAAILPHIKEDRLQIIFDIAKPNLKSTDNALQKKSYRILEEICSMKSESSKTFVHDNLPKIQKMLIGALSKSSSSSKTPRLRCLIHIFQNLEKKQMNFVMTVLPEAILCTKEVGGRARSAAYSLLITIGDAMIRWRKDKSEEDVIYEYIKLILAGLAGGQDMVSSSLFALTRVFYQYKDKIPSECLDALVDNVCLLLQSKSREIVQSALGFIKVMLSAYKDTTLAGQLKTLVSGLVSMKDDCKHHFHLKNKQIYTKLIKRFGYEIIHKLTPENVHKVLVNIRKRLDREKRNQLANEAGDSDAEEDDDDDDDMPTKSKPETIDELLRDTDSELDEPEDGKKKEVSKRKKGKKAFIQEEGTEIVDFLDPSANKKIFSSKPNKQQDNGSSKRREELFKRGGDGRLVITTEQDDTGEKIESDMEDDLEDIMASMDGKRKKTKKRVFEELDSDDDDGSIVNKKYKAGGKGIHRQFDKTKQHKDTNQYGSEYKSKKAGGDVKRKGKPDPYAYVPFDFKRLNKRKQAKLKGQFKGFVKGAKKGALKGSKKRRQ